MVAMHAATRRTFMYSRHPFVAIRWEWDREGKGMWGWIMVCLKASEMHSQTLQTGRGFYCERVAFAGHIDIRTTGCDDLCFAIISFLSLCVQDKSS